MKLFKFAISTICGGILAASVWSPVYAAAPVVTQSIKKWAICNGVADDTTAFQQAVMAAKGNAFTLVVDCPVKLKIGMDIAKPIFFYDDTYVNFTSAGKIIVDNVMVPAFAFVGVHNVYLTGWNVIYTGKFPVINPKTSVGGYYQSGIFKKGAVPYNAFNDVTVKNFEIVRRHVKYDKVNPYWNGPIHVSSMFYFKGNAHDIFLDKISIASAEPLNPEAYVPSVFAFVPGELDNVTVTPKTPLTADFFALPNKISFTNISLDGTLMGWLGQLQNLIIDKVTSKHYADLQDSKGNNVGGAGKWFPPPHLIYLTYEDSLSPSFYNRYFSIKNVNDEGLRVGPSRDTDKANITGYSHSLKLGVIHGEVENYVTKRPDGFMDVLHSTDLKLKNIEVVYDSSYNHWLFPALRFPQSDYYDVTFENVNITDIAKSTDVHPIQSGSGPAETSANIKFLNTKIKIPGQWTGVDKNKKESLPWYHGNGHVIDVKYID